MANGGRIGSSGRPKDVIGGNTALRIATARIEVFNGDYLVAKCEFSVTRGGTEVLGGLELELLTIVWVTAGGADEMGRM